MPRARRWLAWFVVTGLLVGGTGLIAPPPAAAQPAAAHAKAPLLRRVPLEKDGNAGFLVDMNRAGTVLGAFFDDQWQQLPVVWRDYQTPIVLGAGRAPAAINNRGHVVGSRGGPDGAYGWLWRNGRMTYLRTSRSVFAVDVNDHDQVVGFQRAADYATTAYSWQRGRFTTIRRWRGMTPTVRQVNNRGEVLGTLTSGDFSTVYGFVWRDGAMTVLRPPGGGSLVPVDINDRGQVVGHLEFPGSDTVHPFIWHRGRLVDLMANQPNNSGRALAVNNAGDVIGQVGAVHREKATLWRHGRPVELGIPRDRGTSEARILNERGDVAGVIATTVPGGTRLEVFRWRNGRLLLSTPEVRTGDDDDIGLIGIDERGRIVGGGGFAWVAN